MNKNSKILFPGIILAIIVASFIYFPNFYLLRSVENGGFHNIYLLRNNDEKHYLSKAREVQDGHGGLGSVFLKEHKNRIGVRPSLSAKVIATLSSIFNISIPRLSFYLDFVFPFISTFLLYLLFYIVSKKRWVSIFLVLVFSIIFLKFLGRPINPQFSIIFYFLSLILYWKSFVSLNKKGKSIIFDILLGVVFAFLLWLYPFYWSSIFVLYIVSLGIFLIFDRNNFKKYLIKFVAFLTSALLIGTPYLLKMSEASASRFYSETIERLGIISTHYPAAYLNVSIMMTLLLVMFLVKKNINEQKFYIGAALGLSGLLLNWQNIITGNYLQFSSHYFPVTVIFLLIGTAIILSEVKINLIFRKDLFFKIALVILFLVYISLIDKYLIRAYKAVKVTSSDIENMADIQKYRELIDWIENNTEKDAVFLSYGDAYDWLITVYTHGNLYTSAYASYYLNSDKELTERWLIKNYFNNEFGEDYVRSKYREYLGNKFIDDYQNKKSRQKLLNMFGIRKTEKFETLPVSYVDETISEYNELKTEQFESLLKMYEVDYILVENNFDKYGRMLDEFSRYDYLELQAEISDSIIYKIVL